MVADKDFAKQVQEAKKKPRNFAIIAKGPNCLKILLSKKPIKQSDILAAKTVLKGNAVITGVCVGEVGGGLVFRVLEEPSVTRQKLKDSIKNESKLTLNARFEVVSSIEEINEDEQAETPPDAGAGRGAGKVSLVALGKARIEWLTVRNAAISDLRKLKDAIAAEFKTDPEQRSELSAALGKLDGVIQEIDTDLHELLDQILNADEVAREALVKEAKARLARLAKFLATDPIIAEVDNNEVLPDTEVRGPIAVKLKEIAAALGSGTAEI